LAGFEVITYGRFWGDHRGPGNVRQLQNVVERAVILCETPVLSVDESWFRREPASQTDPPISFNAAVSINERELIERALADCAGQVGGPKGAAMKLGLPRQTLESKIKLLGINKFRFRKAMNADVQDNELRFSA
jgi:formate hydrogenlyase transcriptional activator